MTRNGEAHVRKVGYYLMLRAQSGRKTCCEGAAVFVTAFAMVDANKAATAEIVSAAARPQEFVSGQRVPAFAAVTADHLFYSRKQPWQVGRCPALFRRLGNSQNIVEVG
jgi:hypothetical protein